MNAVTSFNFSTKGEKVEDSDFVKFSENGTKLKEPSEVTPPSVY